MFRRSKIILAVLLTACSACTNNNERAAVPREHAYPRTPGLSSEYCRIDSVGNIVFDVNSDAAVSVKDNGCDIHYGAVNATVYVSVTSNIDTPEKFDEVWTNRLERMERNLGGATKNSSQVNNKAFCGVIITSQTVSQTPVQLLAADTNNRVIVSATAFMHNNIPLNTYDSIAPIYRAIAVDITHLAESLKCK